MWTRRLRYLWNRRNRSASLAEEINLHLEDKIEELKRQGFTEADARAQARRAFGNVAIKQEDAREVWVARYWWELLRDTQIAVRSFRRTPWLTLTIIGTLALTIGTNTALFSVIRAVIFKPLPYPAADRLVHIAAPLPGFTKDMTPDRDLFTWRERSQMLESIAGFSAGDIEISDGDRTVSQRQVSVSDPLVTVLGVAPALGRDFEPADFGGSPVALISDRMFRDRFGGDPSALGTIIETGDIGGAAQVIGVLSPEFRLPLQSTFGPQMEPDVVVPAMSIDRSGGGGLLLQVIGRLKPGVPIDQAQTELDGIRTASAPNAKAAAAPVRVIPLHQQIVGDVSTPLLILWIVTGFVLLVACANIASLLLARSSSRSVELAVCAALGAGRGRIIRALLTETLVLSFAGGALGILLAWVLVRVLVPSVPFEVPRLNDVAADWQVGAAAFGICTLTGLICGLLPAFTGSSVNPGDALKERSRASGTAKSTRLHSLLATGELAVALLLMLGAGLCVQSLWTMNRASAAFAPDQVLVADVEAGGRGFMPGTPSLLDPLEAVAEALPGVTSAGIWKSQQGRPTPGAGPDLVDIVLVTPHLLDASGVRLIAGRGFDPSVDPRASSSGLTPAIVNQAYLRRDSERFPDPIRSIGQSVEQGRLNAEIVGVVSDFRPRPDSAGTPMIYLPNGGPLSGSNRGQLLVRMRTSVDATRTIGPLQAALTRAGVRTTGIETLADRMSASIAPRTFLYALLGTFAGIALLLALIGIYGVLNFSVTERTQELGIRMALGASGGAVQRMVLARSGKIAIAGILAGIVGALSLFGLVRNLVYGVEGLNPWLVATISLMLGVGVLIAAYLPARRAGNLDPLRAIRHE